MKRKEVLVITGLLVKQLNSGFYMLEIRTDHQREVLRFMKEYEKQEMKK